MESILVAVALVAGSTWSASAQDTRQPQAAQAAKPDPAPAGAYSEADRTFIMDAASGGKMEVELGKMALQRAENADVTRFAQRMIDDHGKANAQLMGIVKGKGIIDGADIPGRHKEAVTHLSSLSGAQFDKAYMEHMVSDHQEDVKAFEKQSNGSGDAALKEFARTTLPTLREHLAEAQRIAGKLGATSSR